ncbi:response regulator [Saccharospirillum sp. HFRX-1]|uniref:response regulator n=1 Tax=unclassified Saccharospirillum TaxID=2633430 RepID=UPI003722C102
MQVLILEDEVVIRELIKTVLYSLSDDVEVLEADTTHQGRALWQQHRPQLVLCDWSLADSSNPGIELVKYIRETDTDTPILMITGRGDRETVVSSRKNGVTEFIIKPFDPVRLGDRLKTYLAATKPDEAPTTAKQLPALDVWLGDIKSRLTPPPTLGGIRDIVNQLSAKEPPSGKDLTKLWRTNPAITARLIYIANSGMVNRYGKNVDNLLDAINSIGVTMAMQQALALTLNQRDQLSHPALAQQAILLCQDGEKIAAAAATLAKQLKANVSQSYTAGLLYPLGELALLQLMQSYLDKGGKIDNAEIETLLEKLSGDYLKALQQLWKLPQELRERISAAHELPTDLNRHELILMTVAVDQVKGRTDGDDYQRKLGLLGLLPIND